MDEVAERSGEGVDAASDRNTRGEAEEAFGFGGQCGNPSVVVDDEDAGDGGWAKHLKR